MHITQLLHFFPTFNVSVRFKNGVPLDVTNQPRFEVLGEGRQLRIHNSQLMDIGLYTCAAKSRAGEDTIDYNVKILGTAGFNSMKFFSAS